jgi:multidrug efflux system membrane fusion protein
MPSFFARNKGVKTLVLVAAIAALGGAYYWNQRPPADPSVAAAGKPALSARGGAGNRPQPVSVAEVKRADVPIWVSAVGTAVPRNLITVHTRVDGELMKLPFSEGQMVKKGQLLAEIDPRSYQAQLDQANGQLARDAALLENAKMDLARYRDLWAKDSIAKQQLDTQDALVRQYQGTVENDRAQVASAKLQVEFTRVTAPVSGRIGLRQVDPGNQVHAADANGIIIIAQVQPMTVVFAVPESVLPALNQRSRERAPISVEAWDREQKNRLAAGRLLTTDNQIDPTTDTIKMKAEFANQDGVLFPNQFVNTRLLLGVRKDALVVPSAAIMQGARGAYVYVVDKDGKVATVTVTPGTVDGNLTSVEGELQPGSRVVTDGTDKLREGGKVEVIDPNLRAKGGSSRRGSGQGGQDGKPGKWGHKPSVAPEQKS